ncbi:DeoR/GlpR family DNA-binding transcription regulator [Clostridium sardiniense]|uniref:DeoR/GlpR family DNA-binding transcription regulator n=1 Tax=Clostridium sardiniense TaxID=29369 RepID=A0ABS7KSP2_CLOSR|nr:DeoR/GlpR family DNA-binding transcription regulator [Clostridium sardiniense]MBM7833758.1 DeoR/GlpR family transcriptional regulator of sugar metabolism [Clostridium sardiniense]MBY0753834.1 DeoR/GlpR family DNA-binding transcription regulator [Clostridium sardiniense]MDQ0459652.1 DeoR/GlpR family transcriptional regulator of sugar metabolism [Clostridium sardiniense]
MKNAKGLVFKRQQAILKYLKENKFAKTEDLAKLLNTSNITIRRDFQNLENEGVIKRRYGGAELIEGALNEDPYSNEENDARHKIKESIAKKAAEFIEDGDSIFINSSSTAIKILDYIQDKRVVVITNNGKILGMNLSSKVEVILTGGEVYGRKQSMVGDIATQIISKITATKCFMGVSGITSNSGISTSVLQETTVNMKMLENCNGPTFILADSSKIGIHHNFSSGDIDKVNYVITDINANKEEVKKLEEKGVEIIFSEDN